MPLPAAPVVLAAGGILEKPLDGAPHVAVVQRRRYGRPGEVGDWSLPKGHANPGETLAETALREVQEETGCEARITGPARTTSYFAAGAPKLVLFHPMECLKEGAVTDTDEVHSVHWLRPDRAMRVLSYEGERRLIRQHYPRYFRQRWTRRLWQLLVRESDQPERRRRLDVALEDMQRQVDGETPLQPTSYGEPDWLLQARERMAEARRQRAVGQYHAAWGLLREAGRLRLHSLVTRPDLRLLHGQRLQAAAREQLQDWRQDAVRTSLAPNQDGKPPEVERLVHAQQLLDEQEAAQSLRLDLIARRLTTLPRALLCSLLVLWCAAMLRDPTPVADTAAPGVEAPGTEAPDAAAADPVGGVLDDGGQFLLIVILGAIGALVSSVFPTRDPGGPASGLLEPGPELFLRLTMGAMVAVLIGLLLQSGATPLLRTQGPSLLIVVLAAGLADRFLSRTLLRLEQSVRH